MSQLLQSLCDDERRVEIAANDAALGANPRELRPFTIRIGRRGAPRVEFGAMAPDSVTAVMQHIDLCTDGERCEAMPVRSGAVS